MTPPETQTDTPDTSTVTGTDRPPTPTPSTDRRSVTIALCAGPTDASTVAALRLADAATRRGHEVTVYAYSEAVRLGADGCPAAGLVRELVDADARWIVDGQDPRTAPQVAGVVVGDGSDLWRAVRDSDVVLGVTP